MSQAVADTIEANAMRMVSDGIPYRDLLFLKTDIADPDRWCQRWVALSEEYEALAEGSLEQGSRLTAGEHLWRAALCCHFGQGILMDVGAAEKRAADVRKQQLFARAAPLLQPALLRVEIPFENMSLPGYLRVPPVKRPAACMVVFGGLDTTKEDALDLTNYFAVRGIATLTFDGPGQGEVFHRLKLRLDYEAAVSAAIDFLCSRCEIDAQHIGILGRSTGGHWACKTAATDSRVKVAIAWGLIYHLKHFDTLSASFQKRFMRAAGIDSVADAAALFAGYDLQGFAEKIRCPLMVVQGAKDPLASTDSLDLLRRAVARPAKTLLFPDSGHCAHDQAHLAKPAMADFACQHLLP
jgi:2,6-dihydroxypseudooxynicotine hydrolase